MPISGEAGEGAERRPLEMRDHEQAIDDHRRDHGHPDEADPPLGLADHPQDDHGRPAGDRHDEGRQMPEMKLAEARLDDEEHAGKADPDRRQPAPADDFAEKRDGQERDEDRREEDERVGLGKRDGGERVHPADAGDDPAERPQQDALRVVHVEHVAPAFAGRLEDQDDDERAERREEDDLEHRQFAPEPLDDGVGRREQRIGEEG